MSIRGLFDNNNTDLKYKIPMNHVIPPWLIYAGLTAAGILGSKKGGDKAAVSKTELSPQQKELQAMLNDMIQTGEYRYGKKTRIKPTDQVLINTIKGNLEKDPSGMWYYEKDIKKLEEQYGVKWQDLKTGNIPQGDVALKFGEKYTGKLGEFGLSGGEQGARSALQRMLGSQMPGTQGTSALTKQGTTSLMELLQGDKFDPYSEKGTYQGFKQGVRRELGESTDILNRELSRTGSLFSTSRQKEVGLLQERGQQALTNKLGELYETYTQQRINAIPQALQFGITQENLALETAKIKEQAMQGRISMQNAMGQAERLLKDAEAKSKYSEWLRQREDVLRPLTLAMGGIQGGGTTKTTTTGGEDEWSKLFDMFSTVGGYGLGKEIFG